MGEKAIGVAVASDGGAPFAPWLRPPGDPVTPFVGLLIAVGVVALVAQIEILRRLRHRTSAGTFQRYFLFRHLIVRAPFYAALRRD